MGKLNLQIAIPRMRRRKPSPPEAGSRPGTIVALAELPRPVVVAYAYGVEGCESFDVDPDEIGQVIARHADKTLWLDVQGLGDAGAIRAIADAIGLHALTLEDVVHVHQRPKYEEVGDYLFVLLRSIRVLEHGDVDNEQVSMVVKPRLLVTFQERPGDVFDPVRRRLRDGKGHIRRGGSDYLAYALVDAIIDGYFPVVETYTTTMDQLDDAVREDPRAEISRAIHGIRRELRLLRRAVWPLRDVTSALARDHVDHIGESVRPAFRDCYDHVAQVSDFVDGARERASELADLFLIMVGEKTNQVMKLLTIISTIFIPLTFLCGLYGMNFDGEASPYNMPELKLRYGYPALWGVMLITLAGMLLYFRSKGWLRSSQAAPPPERP